jgi:hypothetical protein
MSGRGDAGYSVGMMLYVVGDRKWEKKFESQTRKERKEYYKEGKLKHEGTEITERHGE